MSDDSELERLKAKRLAEMQRNLNIKKLQEQKPEKKEEKKNPRDIVVKKLGYRGLEVLNLAESQFPVQTKMVIQKLAELIESGELAEDIDGGKLLTLFRTVGIPVRVETKIKVEQDGKMVSLSDKLTNKMNEKSSEEI